LRTDTVSDGIFVPLDEATVEAGYRPELHDRAPWAVSHVAPEELARRDAAVDLPYALRFTPSVVVTSDAGTGIGYTGLRVRGSDATRVQVTLNGVPVNDAESHQVYWVNLPDLMGSTDGVQIVRGAASGAYGPGAFGATVAVGTTALAEEAGGRLVLGGGSFGTLRGTVAASTGRLGRGWYGEVRASHVRSDGWVDRASARLTGVHLSVARVADRGRAVYTALLGHERTYQSWFGVPRIALDGTAEEISVWAAGSYEYSYGADTARIADLIARRERHNFYRYADEVDDYRQDHHQLLGEWEAGPWALRGTLNATFGHGYYEQFRDPGTIRQRWLDNVLGGAVLSAARELGPATLEAGLAGFVYSGDHFGRLLATPEDGPLTTPREYYRGNGFKQDGSAYVRTVVAPRPDLVVHGELGARAVTYTVDGTDNDQRTLAVDEELLFFNPKLGADWSRGPWRAFASAAVAHREPSRSDYVDRPLGAALPRPERLIDSEAGLRFARGRWVAELVAFRMDYRDQLVLSGALNDVGVPLRINVDRSWRQGLELSADGHLGSRVRITPTLTWSANRIEAFNEVLYDYGIAIAEVTVPRGTTDIAFSPSLTGAAVVAVEVARGLSAEWAVRHVGRMHLDNSGVEDRSLPAYTVHDLRLRYEREKLAVSAFVVNVLNTRYSSNGWTYSYRAAGTDVTEVFVYPQAGAHGFLTVEYRF
jgi:iron complex outermembrane receptor protein